MSAHRDPDMRIAQDVLNERVLQDLKWGEQNHPDGTAPLRHPLYATDEYISGPIIQALAEDLATAAKTATNSRLNDGSVTWADVLLEEVFEALAEDDPEKLRTELIQVAAVAQQWVGAIDRRTANAHDEARHLALLTNGGRLHCPTCGRFARYLKTTTGDLGDGYTTDRVHVLCTRDGRQVLT